MSTLPHICISYLKEADRELQDLRAKHNWSSTQGVEMQENGQGGVDAQGGVWGWNGEKVICRTGAAISKKWS